MDIQTRRLRTMEQLRAFVEGNEAVDFQPRDRDEAYGFVRDTLDRFGYRGLGKRDKGVVLRFLVTATGISRQQMERLVRQWRETGSIRDRRGGGRGRPFARRYTAADIRRLAEVDEAYDQMSGLATREVLRRQFEVFGQAFPASPRKGAPGRGRLRPGEGDAALGRLWQAGVQQRAHPLRPTGLDRAEHHRHHHRHRQAQPRRHFRPTPVAHEGVSRSGSSRPRAR